MVSTCRWNRGGTYLGMVTLFVLNTVELLENVEQAVDALLLFDGLDVVAILEVL